MNRLSIQEVVKASGGKLLRQCDEKYISGVKHDSRECEKGELFVAITGRNMDGHKFIPMVVENGCRTVMVTHTDDWYEQVEGTELNVILVEDTVFALGELAKYYLSTLDVFKVAVTGSVGKTSTRDMIYYVLSEKYVCGRNMKNYNNLIGLPLSIFRFDDSTEAVVLEMGMDRFGEIDRLAEIVKPDVAVITNIGISHIENLGSRDGIFKAKMEITKHITSRNGEKGKLIFPYDGEYLTKEKTAGNYEQIIVGSDGNSDYIISGVEDFGIKGIEYILEYNKKSSRISIPVPGSHNAINGTLAAAVGKVLGIDIEDAAAGLSKTQLTGSRLRLIENEKKQLTVIDDTYNANPDSMENAIRVLQKSECGGRRIAILGDMYELGTESLHQHFRVGAFAAGMHVDTVIAIGEHAQKIAEGASGGSCRVAYFENKEKFYKEIDDFIGNGDIILVKGSRGMKMEHVVEKLLEI